MATAAEVIAQQYGLIQPQRITEGITNRQLSIVLKDASKEAEQRIAFNLEKYSISGTVKAAQLSQAVSGLGAISTELWSQTGKITQSGMYQMAQLAADQAIDRDFFLGMPGNGILQYANEVHFEAAASVDSLISRRTNGFTLADRIYANGKVGVKGAAREVERGLALQESHRDIAKRVRGFFDPDVPGGVSYASKRLARTEISNAHHETSIRLSQDRPWVTGFKWNLSGSHPRHDVCNDYADRDHSSLGPGVFAKKDVPSKPHPQCLCYLTHYQVDDDEFMDSLVQGNYDDWLNQKGVRC